MEQHFNKVIREMSRRSSTLPINYRRTFDKLTRLALVFNLLETLESHARLQDCRITALTIIFTVAHNVGRQQGMTLPVLSRRLGHSDESDEYNDAPTAQVSGTAQASEEEILSIELESRYNSCKHEISVLEGDLERIHHHSAPYERFRKARENFGIVERQCHSDSLRFQKIESLSQDPIAERRMFATRCRFLECQIQQCQRYTRLLLDILKDGESSTFQAKRRLLSRQGKKVLTDWFEAHFDHPFPTSEEKEELAEQAGASVDQVTTWFINTRARKGKNLGQRSSTTMRNRRRIRRSTEFML